MQAQTIDGKAGLDVGNNAVLSNYTAELKALLGAYFGGSQVKDPQTTYLFVTPSFSNNSVQGYMPRGRNVGFVSNVGAIAHELGHGAFGLEHTFDKNPASKNNLMDYGGGSFLTQAQWKKIQNPGVIINWFDDAEDAMLKNSIFGDPPITKPLTIVRVPNKVDPTKIEYFLVDKDGPWTKLGREIPENVAKPASKGILKKIFTGVVGAGLEFIVAFLSPLDAGNANEMNAIKRNQQALDYLANVHFEPNWGEIEQLEADTEEEPFKEPHTPLDAEDDKKTYLVYICKRNVKCGKGLVTTPLKYVGISSVSEQTLIAGGRYIWFNTSERNGCDFEGAKKG